MTGAVPRLVGVRPLLHLAGGAVLAALAVPTAGLALVGLTLAPGVRDLERAQARALLSVDVPAVARPGGPGWLRLRSAPAWRVVAWLALRAAAGATTAVLLVLAAFACVAGVFVPFQDGFIDSSGFRTRSGPAGLWFPLAAVLALAAVLLLARALAALLARAAPGLLGPGGGEEVARLTAENADLAARTHIAADLHDSVGHAVTVTLLQAAAARRVLDTDPDAARRALDAITAVGTAAMADLDRVLGALAGGPTPPVAAGPDLGMLLAAVRATGLPVLATGEEVVAALPEAEREVAYRTVQEALTNVLRHAGTPPTSVDAARSPGSVRVAVTNGAGTRGGTAHGTGRGLAGLDARARAHGGRLAYGPAPDGGWSVVLELPAAAG